MAESTRKAEPRKRWRFLARDSDAESGDQWAEKQGPAKWSMGVLNDKKTVEVPGSVLLLASDRNEPLGLRNQPARASHSSLPTGPAHAEPTQPPLPPLPPLLPSPSQPSDLKKTTKDGKVILEPQPDDSANDPLNWPAWKRDCALLSLGLYCMVGGGMTPVLAAGFTNVSHDYGVPVTQVSLTTGLYMLGLGLGSIIFSPTAILYGKRPVYLFSFVLFILSAVWCALSPNFASLILARIFMGISVSPVECLPSATIAEIFFLHERAFRIGIYTLLLLGGKNLVPLVSAAVIQQLGWRWAFWIVAMVVATCGVFLFLFVPETFWDRTPVPKKKKSHARISLLRRLSRLDSHIVTTHGHHSAEPASAADPAVIVAPPSAGATSEDSPRPSSTQHKPKNVHVGFAPGLERLPSSEQRPPLRKSVSPSARHADPAGPDGRIDAHAVPQPERDAAVTPWEASTMMPHPETDSSREGGQTSPAYRAPSSSPAVSSRSAVKSTPPGSSGQSAKQPGDLEIGPRDGSAGTDGGGISPSRYVHPYTHARRQQPAISFVQQLKPYHGRFTSDKWLMVAIRPFILFSYPAILWSAAVYALSVGWLIVISESIAIIYRNPATYNFNALQTGLVYVSPFVGGIIGTAVAGKVSDAIVKAMARRNGGLYEPEFRLVMALPVALTTTIGLMGFGWSAQAHDAWIVPTIFFGLTSFGCSLGSTTSITFCVDSYRQYAGEALVTLNFSKNVLHGFIFSLFVTNWLTSDGAKSVYIWTGVIHLIVLLTSVPMYIYGKRARMWTVRKNFVERVSVRFEEIKF